MRTKIRKEIDKGIADKLLLKDATNLQIIKKLHKSHRLTMVECALLAGLFGWILGRGL